MTAHDNVQNNLGEMSPAERPARRTRNAFMTVMVRSIRDSLGRFLAIFAIVALGCGFYAGLQMAGPLMREEADRWYDGTNLWDLRLVSTMGFSDDEIDRVRDVEGVEEVAPSQTVDVMMRIDRQQVAARITSLDVGAARRSEQKGDMTVASEDEDYLNRPQLLEGRWPEKVGECVVGRSDTLEGLSVGSTVKILYADGDMGDYLACDEFEIVGTVRSSDYPYTGSYGTTNLGSGTISVFVLVPQDTFEEDAPYTDIYLTVEGARAEFSQSDAYYACTDVVKRRLEDEEGELASHRQEGLKQEAQEKLDEKRATFERERADALAKLADGERELDDGARELADGKSELDEGKGELDSGKSELDEAWGQIVESAQLLSDGEEEYEDGVAEYELERAAAYELLDASERELDEGERELLGTLAAQGMDASNLDEATAQVEAALAEVDEQAAALEEAEAARAQIESQAAELDVYAADLEEALADAGPDEAAQIEEELAYVEAQRSELSAALDGLPSEDELDAAWDAIESTRSSLEEALAGIDELAEGRAQLEEGRREADEGFAEAEALLGEAAEELDDGWEQLEAGLAEYDAGLAEYDAGITEYESGLEEYEKGVAEYEDGRATYDSERTRALREIANAQEKIDDAQHEIDTVELPDLYVLDRAKSEGAQTYHDDSMRMDKIAAVFPVMFFLVAALVALSSMTRMVDDDRTLIGTYKALGYSKLAIAFQYLAYGALAAGLGAIVGILALCQILPLIIIWAYGVVYCVPQLTFPLPIDPGIAVMAGGLGLVVTVAATLGAVYSSLREVPSRLMQARAPKPGKRILIERVTPLWSRVSFSWKVTFRNLLRYKRRFFMTVVGISGCTALLLVGFGLHDSIWDIIDRQYGPIIHYDAILGLDEDATSKDAERVLDVAAGTGAATNMLRVQSENMQVGAEGVDGTWATSVVIVSDPSELAGEVTLKDRLTQEPVTFEEGSAVITEKCATVLGVRVGDTVHVYDQDEIGNASTTGFDVTITGVAENYVANFLYLASDVWTDAGREKPPYTTIYASVTDDSEKRTAFAERLEDEPDVSIVSFSDETIDRYREMLTVIDYITIVIIVCAGLLAFIVLYNLTNINVDERVREIASLKVLGFTRREVYAYVFREILLLSIIGDVLGMGVGTWLESFTVVTAEVDYVMFGRTIHVPSYAYAFVITLVFTVLILFIMRRKLDHVSMVESLKSVD